MRAVNWTQLKIPSFNVLNCSSQLICIHFQRQVNEKWLGERPHPTKINLFVSPSALDNSLKHLTGFEKRKKRKIISDIRKYRGKISANACDSRVKTHYYFCLEGGTPGNLVRPALCTVSCSSIVSNFVNRETYLIAADPRWFVATAEQAWQVQNVGSPRKASISCEPISMPWKRALIEQYVPIEPKRENREPIAFDSNKRKNVGN